MPKFRNYQSNFSGGLLSEGMLGRADLATYENGCKQLENWWPKVTGGVRRRPGSLYMNILFDALRIESFIFSESQAYVVSFHYIGVGEFNYIQFYDHETGDVVTQIQFLEATPDIIKQMSITQQGDVMFLAHRSIRTKVLRRTGASSFVITDFEFDGEAETNAYPKKMPFVKFADGEVTITPNAWAKGATVTVTASASVFNSDMVGRAIRYRGKQILVTNFNSVTSIRGTILEELDQGMVLSFSTTVDRPHDFRVGEIIVGRDSGTKAEVMTTSSASIAVALIAGRFAVGTTEEVEGLTSGNIAKITGSSTVNPLASTDWEEEAFSNNRGWPGVIEFHSQRLWLAGSSSLPAHIFGSRVAAFFNFDVGDALPADSIQAVIAGKQINLITDIVSGDHLQVFTDKGEYYAPQSEDRPLVPETFDLLPQTRYGSKQFLEPKLFDDSTLFVQTFGNAVREFRWTESGRYTSDAISLISEEHLNNIQDLEVLYGGYDRPEQLAFFVNGDGSIVWYHSARAESIRAWGKWTTNGLYKSLTVVQDKLWAMVERTTNAGPRLFLERFELDATMDCMVYHTSVTAKNVWTSVHVYLADQTLGVTSGVTAGDNDYFLGEFVATGNTIDLTPALGITKLTNIGVGLNFTQKLEPMPIEIKDQNGITTGMPKRIVYADLYIASTLAVQLNGRGIQTFQAQNDLTQKPAAITGLRKFYLLGYSERPTVVIQNNIPLACEVLSLGAEVEY